MIGRDTQRGKHKRSPFAHSWETAVWLAGAAPAHGASTEEDAALPGWRLCGSQAALTQYTLLY